MRGLQQIIALDIKNFLPIVPFRFIIFKISILLLINHTFYHHRILSI